VGAFVLRAVPLAVALAALAGCGGGSSGGSASVASPLPVLPVHAIPDLPASTHSLGVHELAADVGNGPLLSPKLETWGFERGRERVFQGESHRFNHVVSRTLEFQAPEGAAAYVLFVATHVGVMFGIGSTTNALQSAGRSGYLITEAACACHRAEPTLLAVLGSGRRVTYLEVNGGGATPAAVRSLVAQAP